MSQPSPESLKKVVDGKVALMEGEQEGPLPGGDAEGTFCVSLSKLLHLDEARMKPNNKYNGIINKNGIIK